jgi:hypothetical protein
MKPAEKNCTKKGREEMRENDGGGNLVKVYCRHICKCHNETPPVQLIYTNKNVNKNTGERDQVGGYCGCPDRRRW